MRGWAAAFESLDISTQCEILVPDRTAISRTTALLRRAIEEPLAGPGVVLLRSHWSLPPAVPYLNALRHRGHAVVIDCPTPAAAGIKEIRGSDRGLVTRVVRLANEAMWTPLAWPAASLVVEYAADGAPWRRLAASRRLALTNGVDVASRPLHTTWLHRPELTFVCAGALGAWHGLDRLLRGMAAAEDASRLLVVGEGPANSRLGRLAEALGVADRVEFHAPTSGAGFDELIGRADIGVASLAEHRRGGFALSPLKTRDYLARGMPVLFAGDDPDLRPTPAFAYRLPADDSAVPVRKVGDWLTQLRQNAAAFTPGSPNPQTIRAFAADRLDLLTRADAVLAAIGRPATNRASHPATGIGSAVSGVADFPDELLQGVL